jgi:hypothetical protein
MPCVFDDIDTYSIRYHHPLPHDQVIKVDSAGMGLVIMHRSVIKKLKEKYGKKSFLFAENNVSEDEFIGEDISFFRKCKEIKIPVYCNTGAIAKHIKRIPWDQDYYGLYWKNKLLEVENNK